MLGRGWQDSGTEARCRDVATKGMLGPSCNLSDDLGRISATRAVAVIDAGTAHGRQQQSRPWPARRCSWKPVNSSAFVFLNREALPRRCTWQVGQLFGALALCPRVHRMRMRAGARRALIWGQPGCPAARLLLTFFINSTRLGEEEEEEEEEECCGAYLLSHCVVVIRPGLRGPGLVRISRI